MFAVWCKTIKYRDNISNSIYDSQESTPTRTRNIQISWDLNQKLKLVKQEKSLSGIYRWKCVCLLFQESRWWLIWCYPVCFLLGWYLQLSPLARTLRGARRESSEEWGVSSFYWSQVWLLSAQLSCSGCITPAHSVTLSDPAQDTGPGSLPQHTQSSAERAQILIQGIQQNMQIKLALCICIHHSFIICIHRYTYIRMYLYLVTRSY